MMVLKWNFALIFILHAVTRGQAELQITPFPTAEVVEYESLTLTCKYGGFQTFSKFAWRQTNGADFAFMSSNCSLDSKEPVPPIYHYNCSSTKEFSWTFLNVTNKRHGEKWFCTVDTFPDTTDSSPTTIYVVVPVKNVSFVSPSENPMYVIENVTTQFVCETTAERPRSSIEWFVKDRDGPFKGFVLPTDNDTLFNTLSTLDYSFDRSQNASALYCTAVNVYGREPVVSNSKEITVLFPPDIPKFSVGTQYVSTTLYVIKADYVNVTCESIGNPAPSYKWTGQADGSNTLFITNINSTVTASCTVRNAMVPTVGPSKEVNATALLTIRVRSPPDTPTLKVESQTITDSLYVVKGDNVRVACESSSDSGTPTYQWTGHIAGESLLIINNIQSTITKTCTASITMDRTVGPSEQGISNATLTINVMSGPTIPSLEYVSQQGAIVKLSDTKLVVIKGITFSLKCFGSTSVPEPSNYRWSGLFNSTTRTINFISISVNHAGNYTCHVENTMARTMGATETGENSKSIYVEVHYPPEIDELQDITVVEDKRLTLPCIAHSLPSPSTYSWTRSKDDFKQQSSTLSIDHTRREDSDMYTCTVQNQMQPTIGEETSGEDEETVNVKILYHPVATMTRVNGTDITEGDRNVMLVCSAKGEPHDYAFANWIHYAPDGRSKIQEKASTMTENDRAYLVFANIHYMDSGVYGCSVSNGIRSYKTKEVFAKVKRSLLVKGRPIIISKGPVVIANINQNASLWVTYYPNDAGVPTVRWYKKEDAVSRQEIDSGLVRTSAAEVNVTYYSVKIPRSGYKTELLIYPASPNDFGDYEIEISNSIDTVVATTQLIPGGPPESPKKLALLKNSTTSSSVVLTWVSGFHGGSNQMFYIQYRTANTSWRQSTSFVKGGLMEKTAFSTSVGQLASGTEYIFRVFAENMSGRSGFSLEVITTTSKPKDEPSSSSNIGAIAGGVVAGVIAAIVVILVVLFLLRKYERLPTFKKKQRPTSDEMEGHDEIQVHNYANVSPSMSGDSNLLESDEVTEHHYANTNVHSAETNVDNNHANEETRKDSLPYANVNVQNHYAVSKVPYANLRDEQMGGPKPVGSIKYDDLDREKKKSHFYTPLEAAETKKKPLKPATPAKPVKPSKPVKPAKPVKPVTPPKPGKSGAKQTKVANVKVMLQNQLNAKISKDVQALQHTDEKEQNNSGASHYELS